MGTRPLAAALAAILVLGASSVAVARERKVRGKPGPAADGAAPADLAPARTPDRLACSLPDGVMAGGAITVECDVPAPMTGKRAQLHYRPSGSEEYIVVAMEAGSDRKLRAAIPAAAVRPSWVHVYADISDAAGTVVFAFGHGMSPSVVPVRAPVLAAAVAAAGVIASGTEVHAGEMSGDVFASASGKVPARTGRRPKSAWVGLSVGTGYGWQPTTTLETRADLAAGAGFAPAALGHLAPEVGYQLSDRWAVSVRSRHQYVRSSDDDPDVAGLGTPQHWAHALLVRAHYVVEHGPFLLYGVGQLGGGEGYRFRFAPDPGAGRLTPDTTRAGPIVLGPGGGAIYHFGPKVAAVAELDLLLGAPAFGALAEVNLGVQMEF